MGSSFDDDTLNELAKTNPDLVAQYRAKMQGPNDAVQTARDTQNYGNVANVLGDALNNLGNARRPKDVILGNRMDQLGKAPTVISTPERAFDPSAVNNATKQGLEQAKDIQTQAANTFNEEQKLTDMGRGRDWQDKSQAQTQKGWDVENRRNNPNGPQAKQAKLLLQNALLAKATEAEEAGRQGVAGASDAAKGLRDQAKTAGEGMNASDIVGQAKLINDASYDKVLEMRVKKSNMDANRDYRQGLQEDRQQRASDATTAKTTAAQNLAAQHGTTMLETARGSPAVAQAEKDVYAADKADSLSNLYGDPNKLSMPQVQLLAAEIGKIANGGVSSQHELEAITPNSLTGQMSKVTSALTNEPTPANAAAFVKQYQDYTKALRKDAQNVLTDKYGRIIDSLKSQVSPDQAGVWTDKYLNRFKASDATSAADPTVDKYAKDHGLTYEQALAIKQSRSK